MERRLRWNRFTYRIQIQLYLSNLVFDIFSHCMSTQGIYILLYIIIFLFLPLKVDSFVCVSGVVDSITFKLFTGSFHGSINL